MPQSIDARGRVEQLLQQLTTRNGRKKPEFVSLASFLTENASKPDRRSRLQSPDQDHRRVYLDLVIRALSGLYVHMPFKRARHGASPVERLRALSLNLPDLTDLDIQQALLGIFLDLHDPHTFYVMPKPYDTSIAFLPFLVAACYHSQPPPDATDDPEPFFVVTRVARGFECPGLEPRARITHWNGMPIGMAVHQMALRENGANRYACFARAIHHLTIRPLGKVFPPDAPTMTVGFQPKPFTGQDGPLQMSSGSSCEAILDWSVRVTTPGDVRDLLFGPNDPQKAGWTKGGADFPVDYQTTFFPHPTAAEGVKVGIIRIRSFRVESDIAFTDEFAKLIERIANEAPLALIIDVRGNSGGVIQCGERILQLLTPGPITPVFFQFLNTALIRHVAKQNPLKDFTGFGLDEDTGAVYSQAAQITSVEEANDVGQRYYGRIALITDALCYSTTDIFAAGFQDHRIGPVVGVDRSTGAGGANVWRYNEILKDKLDHEGRPFHPLLGRSDLQISVRHCIRTGRSQGQILEDFGVVPDYPYFMTERDLFGEPDAIGKDRGLYEFTFGKILESGGLKDIFVDLCVIEYSTGDTGRQGIEIRCQTSGVSRCEVIVNNTAAFVFLAHPDQCQWQGTAECDISAERFTQVELRCYDLVPKKTARFYTVTEAGQLPDPDRRAYRLVASRKVFESDFLQFDNTRSALSQSPTGRKRRRKILYVVRGRSAALQALEIANNLSARSSDLDIHFASYGSGASTLRDNGHAVIDLGLPDRPRLFQVQQKFAEVAKKWQKLGPQLIVAHDEFEIAHLAGPSEPGNTRKGPTLPCPCVLIANDLDRSKWHHREALLEHLWETILLQRPIPDFTDHELSEFRISRTGPVLRPLRHWQPELSAEPASGRARLARQESRKQARQALGYPEDELIVSVFVDPFGRTELTNPLCERLQDRFNNIRETEQTRPVLPQDWSTEADNSRIDNRPFNGKRLLWDRAAGVRAEHTFESHDYDLVMAASDMAFTKGDTLIELELQFMGVPTMSFLPWDQIREWSPDGEDGASSHSAPLSYSPYKSNTAPKPDDGVQNTALRLEQLLRAIVDSPAPEIERMVNQIRNRELDVALFRRWFSFYRTWYQGRNEDLVEAVSSVLDAFPPKCYEGVFREAEEQVSSALDEAVRQWTESSQQNG